MNPFYHPEEMGLTQVAMVDYSSGSYEFDYRVIWLHTESKTFYTARDSGCSCPTPFDSYGSLDTLDTVQYDSLRDEVMGQIDKEWRSYLSMEEAQEFLKTVHDAMKLAGSLL